MPAPRRRSDYVELDDAELVEAMRRDEPRAVEEFVARYRALLLDVARRRGVPESERDEMVSDVLHDVAIKFATTDAALPAALSGYLLTALRNRLQNVWRGQSRSAARDALAASASETGEQIVQAACSEDTVRASLGAGADALRLTPALERLASALDERLTHDERRLLAWLGAYVPQRRIAQWLDVKPSTAMVRIWRLRERLREAALRYAAPLDADERAELMRFFRRTANYPADRLRGLAEGVRSPSARRVAEGGGGDVAPPVGDVGIVEEEKDR